MTQSEQVEKLVDLFDAAMAAGGVDINIWCREQPHAVEALRAFAESHGMDVKTRHTDNAAWIGPQVAYEVDYTKTHNTITVYE